MSNRQQTLFRFVSLRAPEAITKDKKEQRKLFVLHPDNQSGAFFEAVKKRPDGQTKWQAMAKEALTFNAFSDSLAVDQLNPEFIVVAQWVVKNKSRFSVEELDEKISNLRPFDASTEITLWDNLFYQVVTQKSAEIKESLCLLLVLQNLLKEKEGKDSFEKLANATVVLAAELFIEEKTSPKEEGEREAPIFDIRPLVSSLQKALSLSSSDRNHQAIKELQKLQKKYLKEYNRLYQTAQSEYELAVKDAYSRATMVEKERMNNVTGIKETYIVYENLVLPEFKFIAPVEIDAQKLKVSLSEQSYYVVDSLALLEETTYNDIIDGINEAIAQESKLQKTSSTDNSKLVLIGGMVFERKEANSHPLLSKNQKPYAATLNWLSKKPKRAEVITSLDLGDAGKIVAVSYKITLDAATKIAGNEFTTSSNGSIENITLFPNIGIDLGQFSSLKLSVEVVLNTAAKISFTDTLQVKGNAIGVASMVSKVALSAASVTAGGGSNEGTVKYGVTRLGIADYRKVVAEVCCYKAAEVAHIENIMASEFRNKTSVRERIEETTVTSETEQEIENLTDTTTTERFEMQSEIAKLLQQRKELTASVNVHAEYGTSSMDIGGAYANDTTKEESNRQAVIQSKELTQRAMERIVSRFKLQTTKKTTESFKEENAHIFDNRSGNSHVSGVYRYINAVYKNQIHNYGKRLMYEFMIPQPSKLYRYGMEIDSTSSSNETPIAPPPPTKKGITNASSITRTNYLEFAALYNAAVEAPPETYMTVGKSYQYQVPAGGNNNTGKGPHSKEFNDLKIIDGYKAFNVSYVFAIRSVGDIYFLHLNAYLKIGDFYGTNIIIDTSWPEGGKPTCKQDFISSVTFPQMANYTDVMPVAVTGWDIGAYSINVSVTCELTTESFQNWQQKTYNAIITAYQERLAEFYEKANQNKATILTGNPLFYRQIEQSILKKSCMAYLVQDEILGKRYLYEGLTDVPLAGNDFADNKILQNAELEEYASLVKFMEQAFEWNLMSYSFYPYYWGDRHDWKQLFQSEDDDATFRSFMQAGMARVVVTVKPGFEKAAMYFMGTNQIWEGGTAPSIDDPLFKSIVQELEQQEYIVEETWETILPTSLVALQNNGAVIIEERGLPCNKECQDGDGSIKPNDSVLSSK